jgi:hypothetical protein
LQRKIPLLTIFGAALIATGGTILSVAALNMYREVVIDQLDGVMNVIGLKIAPSSFFKYQFKEGKAQDIWPVFRTALSPDYLSCVSDWASNQLYMGHFALFDVAGEDFYAFERFSRGRWNWRERRRYPSGCGWRSGKPGRSPRRSFPSSGNAALRRGERCGVKSYPEEHQTAGVAGRSRPQPERAGTGQCLLDGSTRLITFREIELTVLDYWQSPRGGRYPARWQLKIPVEDLELEITPYLADQELQVSIRYWEGAVKISGSAAGNPFSGSGYVELTGYGDELQSE